MTLRFFDANCCIGLPPVPAAGPGMIGALRPCPNAADLLAAMDRAGIEKALVWHVAQAEFDAVAGNRLLAQEIASYERLTGCWTLLPNQCGELGDIRDWLRRAKQARIGAVRAFPDKHKYLLRAAAVGDLLDALSRHQLPLILSIRGGIGWDLVYDLVEEFPDLTLILSDLGVWPPDRYFRPLIEKHRRVHIDLSLYTADGGIEAFVRNYGAERILLGSGFPAGYHGSAMLAIAHAEISDAERQLIAGGNLERLLGEVRW